MPKKQQTALDAKKPWPAAATKRYISEVKALIKTLDEFKKRLA